MNNSQIIFNNSIKLMEDGIIGTTGRQITIEYEKNGEKVKELINEPEAIHTYAEWKKAGFQVQKGQKAIAKITIWNWTSKKARLTKEEADHINATIINADGSKAQEGDEVQTKGHYYMKEAAFFSESQVEQIKAPELETVESYIIDENYINNLLMIL